MYIHKDNPDASLFMSFDYVIQATGNENTPNIPQHPGEDLYEGYQTHTIDYREASRDIYHDKVVLVVGTNVFAQEMVSILVHDHPERAYPTKVYMTGSKSGVKNIQTFTYFEREIAEDKLEIMKGTIHSFCGGKTVKFEMLDGTF